MNSKIVTLSILLFVEIFCPAGGFCEKIVIDGPIAEGEFMDRVEIDEVVFADGCGITVIPDYAFIGCTSLRKVTLPQGLKKIGFQAFSECSSLEEIIMPASLEDIGSNSFTYCSSLDNIHFPDKLKHIGHNAFSFCDSLQEAILPDSLEELESYAFSDCASLKKVRLPANDHLLGELMMNCCPNLTEIIAPSRKVPKFDCESFIFDPEDAAAYERCVLLVPENSMNNYKTSKSWQMFCNIATYK